MVTSAPLAADRVLTALEHQPLPITTDGAGWSLTSAEAERLAQIGELRPGFCELGARHVKLAQYCGVVGLGNRVLEVLPKVDDAATSAAECRGVLLRLLGRTERFAHFRHQAVGQHLRQAPLLEVFISTFFDCVTSLARGGLLRQYQEEGRDLNVVRGRIDLARQFGVHANRPDVVTCTFDELTADNVWNRALKKAVRSTRGWIRSAELSRRWIELMGLFDEIDDTRLATAELKRLSFNRQAERYRPAIDWARWILATLSPSIRAGESEAPALLFGMNKLFEAAVASEAMRWARSVPGMTLESQDTSTTMVSMVSPDRIEPAFQLRPDMVFRRGQKVIAIADAKWKRIKVDAQKRMLPSEADLYQMNAYATAFRTHDLTLIYPWCSGLGNARGGELHLPLLDLRAPVVRVACIDVHDDMLQLRCGSWPEI